MKTYRHAALLAALAGMSAGVIAEAEEREGIPPLEPERRRPTAGRVHEHKREIARRLRQQERAAAKRKAAQP